MLAQVYQQILILARRSTSERNYGQTLQPTALAHEAILKVWNSKKRTWNGAKHYLAVAAQAMRHVLVDHTRAKKRAKRQPGAGMVSFDLVEEAFAVRAKGDLLALDEALERLAEWDEQAAEIVVMRCFGGCRAPEIATALGVNIKTVERKFAFAKRWLETQLGHE